MKKHSLVVLDVDTMGDAEVFEQFKTFGSVTIYNTTQAHERSKHIGDATIVITNKVVLDKEILSSSHIELICLTATGMNNVDLDYAQEHNITVKNVAGYSTESVAQHTFALLLSFLHHTAYYNSYVFSGEYSSSPVFTHFGPRYWELQNKTWGIIGLGSIGKRVAHIAQAFGCSIQYYSTSGKNNSSEYSQCSLESLLKTSDIISIHAPLNEHTQNLLKYDEMKHMQKHAILINVGRGGIVNESDIAQILREDCIGGVCLDVLEQEPIPKDSPLLHTDIAHKLHITPHVAWISNEALDTLFNKVFNNIKDYIEQKK
ncbi:MAG: D-2-hydroxyacid dehydrogenase [Bacteroidales bacterium]|jgi:lactate dehydrogenase-like 2-hydroxyacid dehydrogenase|nr:D-2-hydroxyacid dehydrogenase [Bacteroidales bacterium]